MGSGSRAGSNFVSELHTVSLPVIEPAVCRRPEVYGGEKVSTGMFCAGLRNYSNRITRQVGPFNLTH